MPVEMARYAISGTKVDKLTPCQFLADLEPWDQAIGNPEFGHFDERF